ncbi:hypothetical protein QM616_09365 [Rhodococcus fascians]|uniref:O-antigen ligase family protein n=1 Tax=Rhodococcoides fascians TaxID=1828 RepID=UPI0024B7EDCC|nr:hypothetical protein [Rhodococcus fascians]MDJ0002926.1 hypothetical protein [Rhodococcus fascians]
MSVLVAVAGLTYLAAVSGALGMLVGALSASLLGLYLIPRHGLVNVAACLAVLVLLLAGLIQRSVPALGTMSIFAILILVLIAISDQNVPELPAVVKFGAVGYVGFCVIHTIYSAVSGISYALNGLYSMLVPVVAVMAGYRIYDGRSLKVNGSNLLISTICLSLVINALVGYRQALFGLSSSEEAAAVSANSAYLVRGQARLMGAMPTNQDFGITCALVAPVLLLVAVRSAGRQRFWSYFGFANAIFLSFLTLLRGALIAAVISCIVVLVIPLSVTIGRRMAAVLTILISVPVFSWLFISFFPSDRVEESVSRVLSLFSLAGDSSFRARDEYTFPVAISALEDGIFGSGVGSAGPVSQKFSSIAPFGALIPDNGYLIIAIQIGVLGAASILVCLVGLAWRLLRQENGPWGALGIALITLLVAFIFGGYWGLTGPIAVLGVLVGHALRKLESSDGLQFDALDQLANPGLMTKSRS